MREAVLGGSWQTGLIVGLCGAACFLALPPAWGEASAGAAVGEGQAPQVVVEEGAESPEAVFEGMKAAAEAKDYDALVRLYTPEARRAVAALCALTAWRSTTPGWADLEQLEGMGAQEHEALRAKLRALKGAYLPLLEKYGVPVFNSEKDLNSDGVSDETLDKLSVAVGDGTLFWAEYMKVIAAVGHGEPKVVRMEGGQRDGWLVGTATASLTYLTSDGQEQTHEAHFLRIDGRWYLNIDPKFREYMRSVFGDRLGGQAGAARADVAPQADVDLPQVEVRAPLLGAESPEAVFELHKAAAAAEDYDALVAIFSPWLRKGMAATGALSVSEQGPRQSVLPEDRAARFQAGCKALQTKYGLPDVEPGSHYGPEGLPEPIRDAVLAAVGDGSAFLAEYLAFLQSFYDDTIDTPVRQENLAVHEDTAVADVTFRHAQGHEYSEKYYYIRVDGRWYLDADPTFKASIKRLIGDKLK